MATACNRFRAAVLEGDLTHDGSAVLARHVGHTVAKDTPYGQIITKDGNSSPRKIDAAVAAVVAFERAEWWAANDSSNIPLAVFV
jgi:phage terminase large subunit-like protein